MSPRVPRKDPRIIRDVLAHADQHGVTSAERAFGVHHGCIYRWRKHREQAAPGWPTQADIDEWIAKAPERARIADQKRRYNIRRHLNRGPILIDATGTNRRLQALGAIGYTQHAIGTALNLTAGRVSQLARGRHRQVSPEVAAAVAELYNRWYRQAPPQGKAANQARAYAKRRGWVSGMAWDDGAIDDPDAKPIGLKETHRGSLGIDEAAIVRRMSGDLEVRLRGGEAIELVRRMTAAGHGPGEIQQITGVNAARVLRDIARRERNQAKHDEPEQQTSEEAA